MKKYKIIIIFLSMFLLVNVKAFTMGTQMDLSIKSTSKSTSMYWFWAATDNYYCKNDIKSSSSGRSKCTTDDKGSYIKREDGINLDIYSAQEQGSGKTHEAYCINAHLNDSKNGVVEVKTVIGTPDDPRKKLHAGYAAIFDKYNNGSDGYSKAQFISALRVYTIHHETYSKGPLAKANDNTDIREEMYYHYYNLTEEIYSDITSYKTGKRHFYFKSCNSNSCTPKIKKKIKELIDAAETAFKNYKENTSTPEVVFAEEKTEGDVITYKVTLKNFVEGVSKIKFLSLSSGTYNSVNICSDASCPSDIGLNKDYVAKNNNDTLYLKIELNDQGKDAVCNGKLDIKYSFDGAGGYTGAILSNGNETYQRYIFIEKSQGNEETQTLPKSTKISCDKPVDNCDTQYPNKSSLDYLCCKNPDATSCDCLNKTGEKLECCLNPDKEGCTPSVDNCNGIDKDTNPELYQCCKLETGSPEWLCCMDQSFCEPSLNLECSIFPSGSIEKYCCENPEKCDNPCDSTKVKCGGTCSDSIDTNLIMKDCSTAAGRVDTTFANKEGELFDCIINNEPNNFVKEINKYTSLYCKESYTYNMPGNYYIGSGRNMNLDLSLKNAQVDCYITTSRGKYTIDSYQGSIDLYNEFNYYELYKRSGAAYCTLYLLSEDIDEYYECLEKYEETKEDLEKNLLDSSNSLKTGLINYKSNVEKTETYLQTEILDYGINTDTTIKYDYDEPYVQGSRTTLNKKFIDRISNTNEYYKDSDLNFVEDSGYCIPYDVGANEPFEESCSSPSATSTTRHLFQCEENLFEGVSCGFKEFVTNEPYYRLTRTLKEKVDYKTKRWYYVSVPQGDIIVNDSTPSGSKNYSLINGVPIAFTTPEGIYEYSINFDKIGIKNGYLYNNIKSTEKKYVCKYMVDESVPSVEPDPPNDEPKYCIKTTNNIKYICSDDVYFNIKSIPNIPQEQLNNLIINGDCILKDEYGNTCVSSIYDYNCDDIGVGRKCTSTIFNESNPSPNINPPSNKIYDVEYRTITTNNLNPTNRTLGYNWDIKSTNSLLARKALDTMNYISYRSKAEYAKVNGILENPKLKEYGEKDTNLTIELNSYTIEKLRKYDITDDTLDCYDLIVDNIDNIDNIEAEKICEEKGYTWIKGECRAENIFCYSEVITDLINDSNVDIDPGTRPDPDDLGDIKLSNFKDYSDLSEALSMGIEDLSYIPIKETESTAISSDYYQINTAQDYWTVYDFVTLDVDNDNNADVGPSWR